MMNHKSSRRGVRNISLIGPCCLLFALIMMPVAADQIFPDLDGDGVIDALDADQDNDGLLNVEEGLVQIKYDDLPPAFNYSIVPDGIPDRDNEYQMSYALQVEDNPAALVAEIVRPGPEVNFQQSEGLPKIQLAEPGHAQIEWTVRQAGLHLPLNIDLLISDLDSERRESIAVDRNAVVGYSISSENNMTVRESDDGKLVFLANGSASSTTGAVLLHVRNRDRLKIEYLSHQPVDPTVGQRAGFVHSFDSEFAGRYTMVTGERDTDSDGAPDHRDIDSDNDDIPDVVESGFAGTIEEAMAAPINKQGIPLFDNKDGNQATVVLPVLSDPDGDGLSDQQEWYLGTDKTRFDTDQDGFSDGEEVTVYRTDPLDRNSSPSVDSVSPESGDRDLDGVPDSLEGDDDPDGDGIPNNFDLDSDNDGIPDRIEAVSIVVPSNGLVPGLADSDADGIPDIYDLDTDDDGALDVTEAGFIDHDNNGVVDDFIDKNTNGWHDLIENGMAHKYPDQDNDETPDFRDPLVASPVGGVMQDDAGLAQEYGSTLLNTGVQGRGCATGQDGRDISLALMLGFLGAGFFHRRQRYR